MTTKFSAIVAAGAISGTDSILGIQSGPTDVVFTAANIAAFVLAAPIITGAMTYGGVALAASVTGTGSMVLSASPTLTAPALGTPTALVGTNITGTAAGLTAGSVTTNANLTGPITSVGNATSIASQTGTGTTFVVSVAPTITGAMAASGTLAIGGATIGTNALAVTGTSLLNNRLTITQGTATQALLVSTGGSNTGSDQTSAVDLSWTLNTSGSPDVIALRVTDTARGASTRLFNIYGGASGTTTEFSVDRFGNLRSPGALILATSSIDNAVLGLDTTSSGLVRWNADTGLSRVSAGVVGVGTGAQGSVAGTVSAATFITGSGDAASSTGGALQVAGGASVAKRLWIPAITTSSGLQTAVLCQSSGGEMIADSVACLASSARFKTLLGDAEDGALGKIIRVPIQRWKYRREQDSVFPDNYYSEHIGPTAEDIEAIDSRLVGRDQEGRARSISTDQLLALTIQALQEQQEQIEKLQKRLSA